MKKLLGLVLCGLMSLTLVACGEKTSDEGVSLIVGGSTSVQPLMEVLAAEFEAQGLGSVDVQGGGSSVGTKGAIDGTFDLGMASRGLKEEELEDLDAVEIALDGIVIVVNTNNPVQDISLEDAKKIYTGEITNWKELGGADAEIAVLAREEGSGTRDGFQTVLGFDSEEQVANAGVQNSTGAVVSQITGNENAIGYISLGSLSDEVKALTVDGVEGSGTTIADGTYGLQRPFTLAVKKDYEGAQAFIDFIYSEDGKAIIEENKYIATPAE